MNQSAVIKITGNRSLCYAEFGDPDGEPVFLFHDSPGSRLFWKNLPGSPFRKGVRFIALDRPGWGLTALSGKDALQNWPDDMLELANWLALDKFSVLGYGVGGLFALACAWKQPERLRSAALVDCWGPGGPITGDLNILRKWFIRRSKLLPGVIRQAVGILTRRAKRDPELYIRTLAFLLRGRDRELLNDKSFRDVIRRSIPEGYRQGAEADLFDARLTDPWPISLSEIEFPVHLWFGGVNPFRKHSGEFLSKTIPGAIPHYEEEAGQFWIVENLGHVLIEMLG